MISTLLTSQTADRQTKYHEFCLYEGIAVLWGALFIQSRPQRVGVERKDGRTGPLSAVRVSVSELHF